MRIRLEVKKRGGIRSSTYMGMNEESVLMDREEAEELGFQLAEDLAGLLEEMCFMGKLVILFIVRPKGTVDHEYQYSDKLPEELETWCKDRERLLRFRLNRNKKLKAGA